VTATEPTPIQFKILRMLAERNRRYGALKPRESAVPRGSAVAAAVESAVAAPVGSAVGSAVAAAVGSVVGVDSAVARGSKIVEWSGTCSRCRLPP